MRFGLASRDITPPFPTAMHGYAARKDCFDAIHDPLVLNAVVLEQDGRRAVLCAADLCAFPNDGSTPRWMDLVAARAACPRDNVMLCASHTHGGPMLPTQSIYFRDSPHMGAARNYAKWLEQRLLEAVDEAARALRPGRLEIAEGKTSFPMCRRLERNGEIVNAPNPGGLIENRMRLLLLRGEDGALAAVGMVLACHPVATGAQHLITADFPGAWKAEFTRAFGPQVMPFFLQGSGADARPRHVADGDHWRPLAHHELPALGRDLLAETLQILSRGPRKTLARLELDGRITPVDVPCQKRHTTRQDFQALLTSQDPSIQRYAADALAALDAGRQIPTSARYHVQTLWLDPETALLGLDAEPLAALGRRIESAAAPSQAILLGYVNGCSSYLPDTAEMQRGGYEASCYLSDGWSGPWAPGLENVLAAGVYHR